MIDCSIDTDGDGEPDATFRLPLKWLIVLATAPLYGVPLYTVLT